MVNVLWCLACLCVVPIIRDAVVFSEVVCRRAPITGARESRVMPAREKPQHL